MVQNLESPSLSRRVDRTGRSLSLWFLTHINGNELVKSPEIWTKKEYKIDW